MALRAGKGAGVGGRPKSGRRPYDVMVALALGLSAAACTTDGQPSLTASTARGPSVAFESIDGPPESVFQTLVQDLSDEAQARQMSVVSREGPAQYRVRGYVAAVTQGKRSAITYVWDVYDADQRRALRIAGEEPASAVGQGTWAVADDSVLRRIAHVGMDRLVAFLASPDARPEVPAPADRGPAQAVATRTDDLAPETESAAVPLPGRRPLSAGFASQDNMAYLTPGR